MEHTISLHDSNPEPSPESFDVSASYDAYEEPTPLHAFVAATEPVSDGWVQEEVPDEFEEPEVVQHATHEPHEHHSHHDYAHHAQYEHVDEVAHEPEHDVVHEVVREPVQKPVHEPVHQVHEIHAVPEAPPAFESHDTFDGSAGERRVVLRMTGGETVELRRMWNEDEAVAFAREAVRRIAAAEQTGEWPELDGRFLRPDQIFSVDIQVAE